MGSILSHMHSETLPPPVAEANHRIANSLTLLVSMVRMQAMSVKKKAGPYSNIEVRQLLDGIAARLNTISQLHRTLSHARPDGVIDLGPQLREVTNALVAAMSSKETHVRVLHTGGDCPVPMREVQPIVLILCEIFINAMKYAHPDGGPLVVTVDSRIGTAGGLVLTVSDDGVGLPDGFVPGQSGGMGFKVMHRLAEEVGGELKVLSARPGLSFRLSLPADVRRGLNYSS